MKLEASTLGEICDRGRGEVKTGPFGSQLHQSDYVDDGVPVVMPKNISAGKVDTSDIARIRESDVARLSQHCLSVGDIVYGRRGEIGRHAFISSREKGWLCGTGCLRITPGPSSEVVPRYLHYFLDVPGTISWIANQAIGATMPNLNTSILRSVPISYPSVQTQNKIAAVLSDYDDLIENNLQRIRILEEMAQALYREWFVEFRFPGHERVTFVESPNGKAPAMWEACSLTDLADVLSGGTPRTGVPEYWDGDIPFFTPRDSHGGFYVFSTEKTISQRGLKSCNSRLYPKDTVFVTARGTVGNIAMPTSGMAMNQSCYALAGRSVGQRFLFLCLKDRVHHLKRNTGGATFDTIVVDTFRRIPALRPPEGLVARFESLVAPLFERLPVLLAQNRNLRMTRDLLLPRLISGELDVSDLDIVVPGAVP